MKCPKCNFLNSNSRTNCLKCNFDLTELRSEFGLKKITTESLSNTSTNQSKVLKKVVLSESPSKKADTSVLINLDKKINEIKSRTNEKIVPVTSTKIEDTKEEVTTIETAVTEANPYKEIIQNEILDISDEELDINHKILLMKEQLNALINKWRKTYDTNISALYDSLIGSLPIEDQEIEISTINHFNEAKLETIKNLYNLQLKEFDTVKNKELTRGIQKSDARSIDSNSLTNTMSFLRPKLMEEIEKQGIEETNGDEYVEIPAPNNLNIVLALISDIIITSIFALLTWLFIISIKDETQSTLHDSLKANFTNLINNYHALQSYSFAITFIACWCLIYISSLIFTQASLGQNISGLIVCGVNGKKASLKQLGLRFLGSILNILSLGIRAILSLKKSDGMSCKISKTKLTYSAFVE